MRTLTLTLAGALAATSAAAAITLIPSTADACGGTFCDAGPQQMPVDQTGENVLFILGDNQVEAHIQIQYDPNTDAQSFAWVIPVTALPEFEPGSQPLFDSLLAGTVPTYGFNTTSDQCNQPLFPNGGLTGGAGGTGGGDEGAGDGDGDGDPDVVYQDTVGAFEIAVLDGGTVEGVMQWLGDNGYEQDPKAEPILAEYLDGGFMFVALKLTNGAAIGEIHPIVLRYEGTEPCVPLKLTRIAAQEDMDVRVFFLGEARTVPANYRHVLVNPLMIDWIALAANYKEVISLAVDAESADGNAFVTEYAGSSAVVSQGNLHSPLWDAQATSQLVDSPIGLTDMLAAQGLLMDCGYGECMWGHPLAQGLLSQYVPVPDGVDEADFYDCLECYDAMIDLDAWDAQAFADAYSERIIDPGLHALDLLGQNAYLTRMYTTISPNEMTVDPMFRENANLDDVPNVRIGNLTRHCDGSATMELPDGREVHLEDPSVWPEISDEMPWEEEVATASQSGPLMTLVDNTEQIDALLAEYNAQFEPASETGCGCATAGGSAGTILAFGFMSLMGFSLRRRS